MLRETSHIQQPPPFSAINDDIAERILALRGKPMATLAEALRLSGITEENGRLNAEDMVVNLLADIEKFEHSFSHGIGMAEQNSDYGTADLLTGILRDLQKYAWMFRSFLGQTQPAEQLKRDKTPVA